MANSIGHTAAFFYVDVVVLHMDTFTHEIVVFLKDADVNFFAHDFVGQIADEKQVFFSWPYTPLHPNL